MQVKRGLGVSIFFILIISVFSLSVASAFWPFDWLFKSKQVHGNVVSGYGYGSDSGYGSESAVVRSCQDYDNGINYYQASKVVYNGKDYPDTCNGAYLYERYCSSAAISTINYKCLYGCQNGSCLSTPRVSGYCYDSDGYNLNVLGYVNFSDIDGNKGFLPDSCDGNYVYENTCDSLTNRSKRSISLCSNGCEDGVCKTVSRLSFCSDSDGNNPSVRGNVTYKDVRGVSGYGADYCVGNKLYELSCNPVSNSTSYQTQICSNGCENGACKNPPAVSSYSYCVDFDGYNQNTSSNVTYLDIYGNAGVSYDTCSGNGVLEKICNFSSNSSTQLLLSCSNGCENGACIALNNSLNITTHEIWSYCVNFDGYNVNLTSNVTYLDIYGNAGVSYDTCSGNVVYEQYCNSSSNASAFISATCPMGCQNGACIYSTFENESVLDEVDDILTDDLGEDSNVNSGEDTSSNASSLGDSHGESGGLNQGKNSNVSGSESCDSGCVFNKKCYPFGYRIGWRYCSENNEFIDQKDESKKCNNNFECNSNVCMDNQCISPGLVSRMVNWFKKLFG